MQDKVWDSFGVRCRHNTARDERRITIELDASCMSWFSSNTSHQGHVTGDSGIIRLGQCKHFPLACLLMVAMCKCSLGIQALPHDYSIFYTLIILSVKTHFNTEYIEEDIVNMCVIEFYKIILALPQLKHRSSKCCSLTT